MGREIRRVPEGWEHPRFSAEDGVSQDMIGRYRPQHEYTLSQRQAEEPGQPTGDPAYYRPEGQEGGDHFQLYESTTEGTPRSAVFATREALLQHLGAEGDDEGHTWPLRAVQILRDRGSLITSDALEFGV